MSFTRVETTSAELPHSPSRPRVRAFRTRVFVTLMLVVSVLTGAGLYIAERNLTAAVERSLQREFESQLAMLQTGQEIRHAAMVERSRALMRRARIRGALEEAPDLLYPSAHDELRDLLEPADGASGRSGLRAEFYRFSDAQGAIISGGNPRYTGALSPAEEAQLVLPGVPAEQQIGYIRRTRAGGDTVAEVIAVPVLSSETAEPIASLLLGFKPFEPEEGSVPGSRHGIWLDGKLYRTGLPAGDSAALSVLLATAIAQGPRERSQVRVAIGGAPYQVFHKHLNPGSVFPPAHEVSIYPLQELGQRQRQLRWRVLGTGVLVLLAGLAVSHYASARLSDPVEQLAAESEEQRAALELTSEELQRSARFSADASHQLKTPVTVLRAGLEELLSRENASAEECNQVSALIHQTYRLSTLIEDLLLLSRMDAGRLKLDFTAVNLSVLIEAALDDLGALPDELELEVTTDFEKGLLIAGEKRYTTIILHNLLENARKYNRPGGRIQISARAEGSGVVLAIGNTGRPIPSAARSHIFERFHRGAIGENVPGYGLGLNLARELARLHGGDLRLLRSEDDWTEFEVRLRSAAEES